MTRISTTLPLVGSQNGIDEMDRSLDPLIERIGDSRYVFLGEASHGTSEFYSWRAEITKRLIAEKGFSFMAVEGDWPDCYRVNRYAKGLQDAGQSAYEILSSFNRWPTWMWANKEIVDLIEWIRSYNNGIENKNYRVGFYGLDVYSLWESMEAVIHYLEQNYPDSTKAAMQAYRCFEPYGRDVEDYARATAFVPTSCEDEVVKMLVEIQSKARSQKFKNDGREAYFDAEQNAVVAKNAELYYRTMMHGGAASWNVRDHHMTNTFMRLVKFHGDSAKGIVWAHNTHVGDARATDMRREGMVNLGQLVREQLGDKNVVLAGFGTFSGNVIAAKEWGAPMERMVVPPAIEGSWDGLLHQPDGGISSENKLLIFQDVAADKTDQGRHMETRGQRAIGVVYNPSYERYGNYVDTVLPLRYDAFLYIDKTHALHPLHYTPERDRDMPETFPTGL